MPTAAQFIWFFQLVIILGTGLTLVKLFTSGLYRRYRVFFAFFCLRFPYMIGVMILSQLKGLPGGDGDKSYLYFYAFIYSEPILMVFYILVVAELYRLVLDRYKGLSTLGRWVMYAAVFISTSVSILSLMPKLKLTPLIPEPSRKLGYVLYAERGVDFALVIFILIIVWFLSRYPVPLSRNVVVHTAIYSVYFLSGALVLLWRYLLGYNVREIYNVAAAVVSGACTVAWWLMLSARGEEIQVQLPQLSPGSEERILHQLDLLNDTLLKVSRK